MPQLLFFPIGLAFCCQPVRCCAWKLLCELLRKCCASTTAADFARTASMYSYSPWQPRAPILCAGKGPSQYHGWPRRIFTDWTSADFRRFQSLSAPVTMMPIFTDAHSAALLGFPRWWRLPALVGACRISLMDSSLLVFLMAMQLPF